MGFIPFYGITHRLFFPPSVLCYPLPMTDEQNNVFKSIVREVVQEELKPIKSDIQGIKQTMATKKHVEDRIRQSTAAQTEELKLFIDDTFRKFKNEILTALDPVAGELNTFREEQTIHQGQHDRIDTRLDRVEKHVGLPPID